MSAPDAAATPDPSKLGGAAELSADKITTSTRDPQQLGARIGAWLATKLPADAGPVVSDVVSPERNGMSSETLLFTATWTEDGVRSERACVARIEPEATAVPVFTSYDLDLQFAVMSLVGEATEVPVPEPLWLETDPDAIGAPFFVMGRVDGQVPPDVLPYTFGDNWFFDAAPEAHAQVQDSAIRALAGIHAITPDTHDLGFLDLGTPGDSALEAHLASWEAYLEWVTEGERSPLLDECFAWLRANLPTDTAPPALSWGDARIGNMLFAGNEVAAVLDWEMAAVAPPEVDLGWMIYLHWFFQDLAVDLGVAGMPHLFAPRAVAERYEALTGTQLGDLRWHIAYSAMRHGVIMRRVTERAVLFGEAIRPADIDDMIIHRATLRAMLDGSYWAGLGL